MTKIISIFNHKGGVSKTTTTYHLGWKMASLGKKVLIVDADPQCNLTGLTLGIEDYNSLAAFYDSKKNTDIFNSLAPLFAIDSLESRSVSGDIPVTETKNKNMFLLAGHIRFSEIDIQLGTALTSSETIPILRRFIGAIYSLIQKIARQHQFDIVLIDMSPSVSATNNCILMSSDYFIIPVSPDFYCYQAIDSLKNVLPKWSENINYFRKGNDEYTLPQNNPKMLGFISQNYRIYTTGNEEKDNGQKTMSKAYQNWLDKIKEVTNSKLIPLLKKHEMVIDESIFTQAVKYDSPYHLAGIQNFNTLIPTSQKLAKPIFELTQQDGNWSGAIWESKQNNKEYGVKFNIEQADQVYKNLAESLFKMMGASEVHLQKHHHEYANDTLPV
jgi:chromosome partitioning protein